MRHLDNRLTRDIKKDLKDLSKKPAETLNVRALIKETFPEIREAMKAGHKLDTILETMEKRSGGAIKKSTARGYLYGKDSILNDDDVVLEKDDSLYERWRDARKQRRSA